MARIIIDGYNLIGTRRGDLEAERQRLIEALSRYRKKKGHDITVVFDGWKDGRGAESRTRAGGITVVYTGLGETADSVINRSVTKGRDLMIVVSSDREIQRHAWSRGSTPVDSETFLAALERGAEIADHFGDGEEFESRGGRKGNPRRPSKKEKALRRAISKL